MQPADLYLRLSVTNVQLDNVVVPIAQGPPRVKIVQPTHIVLQDMVYVKHVQRDPQAVFRQVPVYVILDLFPVVQEPVYHVPAPRIIIFLDREPPLPVWHVQLRPVVQAEL